MSAKSDPFAELSEVLRQEPPVRWIRVTLEDGACDKTAGWGRATAYLELTADATVRRIVWVYANGRTLRYGPGEIEDDHGGLPDQALRLGDLPQPIEDIQESTFRALFERVGPN